MNKKVDTKEDYEIYKEGKKEIDEEPFTFKQWKEFNKIMRNDEK